MMEGSTAKKTGTPTSSSTSCRSCWTNERHLRFLNSIEASFVQAMFENNGRSDDLPLDRHIPDSAESTQDLPRQRRRRRCSIFSDAERPRASKKNKIFSDDQVVPQLEIKRDNGDDKDNVDVCA